MTVEKEFELPKEGAEAGGEAPEAAEETAAQTEAVISEGEGSGETPGADQGGELTEKAGEKHRDTSVFFDLPPELEEKSKGKDMFPEDFFWAETLSAKRGRNKHSLLVLLLLVIAFAAGAGLVFSAAYGKGWLANVIGKPKNIEFTLPLADRPTVEDQFYQEDGRYTTEGVAKAMEDSVVSIVSFSQNENYLAKVQGSGMIMSEDGYIVTNAHVISDYVENGVKVRLHDGSEYSAAVVGSDERTDIAVIKIDAEGLKPVQFGNSDQVVLGEEVVAVGSPAGLTGSVSKGIISGEKREIRIDMQHEKMNCIQVDAAVNPGNSGGALVNMWGQVVGIISSKLSSADYDGIGFAICINDAKPIIEDLMEYGCIPGRVRIGISFYEVTPDLAEAYGMRGGLVIVSVDENCDVAKSGIQKGDVITHMNGTEVYTSEDVDKLLEDKKAGDSITAQVFRGEESFTATFKLMDDSSSLKVADDN